MGIVRASHDSCNNALKCFLAREIYQRVMTDFRARQEIIQAA